MTKVNTHAHRPSGSTSTHMVDAAARVAETALAASRTALTRAELHLHAWRVGRDPSTAAWIRDIEQRGAEGTLAHDAIDPDVLREYINEDRNAS